MKQIISALGIAAITVMASCSTGADTATEAAMQAQQKTIDSLELALTRQQVIDSMNEVSKQQLAAAETKTYSAPGKQKSPQEIGCKIPILCTEQCRLLCGA